MSEAVLHSRDQVDRVPPVFQRSLDQAAGRDGCWPYAGWSNDQGYGQVAFRSGGAHLKTTAHRFSYVMAFGAIPLGHQVDHVAERGCSRRDCVNPAHLEAVTGKENLFRGNTYQAANAAKTHCPKGHELSGSNLDPYQMSKGKRCCKQCLDEQHRRNAREQGRVIGLAAKHLGLKVREYKGQYGCSKTTAESILEGAV